jgi:hypothetical protein
MKKKLIKLYKEIGLDNVIIFEYEEDLPEVEVIIYFKRKEESYDPNEPGTN